MYKLLGLCLLISGLAFGWHAGIQLSPIEKITKAFPPTAEVRISLENLEAVAPPNDKSLASFRNIYESKLALRALTCAQNVNISRFDSVENVKKLKLDRDCLREQDDQLMQLIGLKLVGLHLSGEPLRPLVKLGAPSVIHTADGREVSLAKSARKAGVAVLRWGRNEFSCVEIPSGKKIINLPPVSDASQRNFSISPNGRILAIPVNNRDIRFISTESGQNLWLARDFVELDAWLPEIDSALVKKYTNGKNEVVLIDFKTTEIKSYPSAPDGYNSWAMSISDSPSRVLVGSHSEILLVENTRSEEGVGSSIVKSLKLQSTEGINQGTLTLLLNGKAIAFSTGHQNFMLANFETGEEKTFETKELLLGRYAAKLNEDSILVDSYQHNPGASRYQPWALNVKNSTLSPIETIEANSGEIYPLDGRVGFIRKERQKLWVADELKLGEPQPLSEMIAGRKLELQLIALENEEKLARAREDAMKAAQEISRVQQKLGANNLSGANLTQMRERILQEQIRQIEQNRYGANIAGTSKSPLELSTTKSDYGLVANDARRRAISGITSRMLGNLPSDVKVEAIGVYETKNRSPAGINVIIKKSEKPLVLMLSGYEPVRWNLIRDPGANLVAVIATGYNLPEVTGAVGVNTIIKRGNYAYEQNSPGYTTLNNDAIMWTGKSISKFQGTYGGSAFVVGSQ